MSFNSWSEFWAMGGYGYFVWMSTGVTVLALVVEVGVARTRQRLQVAQIRERIQWSQDKEPTP